mgnify:CR=1 FL=1
MENISQILIYNDENGLTKLHVRLEDEVVAVGDQGDVDAVLQHMTERERALESCESPTQHYDPRF